MRYIQCQDNLPAAAAISTMVVVAVGLVLGLRFHSNLVNTRKVTLSPSVEELWRSRFGNPERLSYKLITQENIPDPFRNSCLATIDRFHQGQAITLTCPTLVSGRTLVCVVPGPRKAAAVAATLRGKISPACPASILRSHPAATLFVDEAAAATIRP